MSAEPFLRDTSVHRRPARPRATDDDTIDIRAHPLFVDPWPVVSPRDPRVWRSGRGGLNALWGFTIAYAIVTLILVAIAGPEVPLPQGIVRSIVAILAMMAALAPALALTRLAACRRVAVRRVLPAASTRRLADETLRTVGGLLVVWLLLVVLVCGVGTATGRSLAVAGMPWPTVDRLVADAAVVARSVAWILVALVVGAGAAALQVGVAAPATVLRRVAPWVAVTGLPVVLEAGLPAWCTVVGVASAGIAVAAALHGPVRRGLSDGMRRADTDPDVPVRPDGWSLRTRLAWRTWRHVALSPLDRTGPSAVSVAVFLCVLARPDPGRTDSLLWPGLGSPLTASHGLRLLLLTVVALMLLRSGDVPWRLTLAPGGSRHSVGARVVLRTTGMLSLTVSALLVYVVAVAAVGRQPFDLSAASAWAASILVVAVVDLWLACAVAACLRAGVPMLPPRVRRVGGLVLSAVGLVIALWVADTLARDAGALSFGGYGAQALGVHALAAAGFTVLADRLWRRVLHRPARRPLSWLRRAQGAAARKG